MVKSMGLRFMLAGVTVTGIVVGGGSVEASTPNSEDDFVFNSFVGEIKDYTGSRKDVVIPNKINGTNVTRIGNKAFSKKGIESVELPDFVISIGESAFEQNKLTEIKIPRAVRVIGEKAFSLNDIKTMELPDTVEIIGKHAFSNNKLTEMIIPKNLGKLSEGMYLQNEIKEAVFPEEITEIPANFLGFNNLEKMELPKGVKKIEGLAFIGNNLTEITLPEGLEEIGFWAFQMHDIEEITIPKSVKVIEQGAFELGRNLKKVTIEGKDVIFEDFGEGVFHPDLISGMTTKDIPIYGIKGSTSEKYANEYFHQFNGVGGTDEDTEEGGGKLDKDTQVKFKGGELSIDTANIKGLEIMKLGKGLHKISTGFDGEFIIEDLRGTGEGWGLHVSATPFHRVELDGRRSGDYLLPKGSLLLKDLKGVVGLEGSEALPEGSIKGLGVVIDGGGAVPVLSVGEGSGKGKYKLDFDENSIEIVYKTEDVRVHGEEKDTYYTSTIKWDIISAPM